MGHLCYPAKSFCVDLDALKRFMIMSFDAKKTIALLALKENFGVLRENNKRTPSQHQQSKVRFRKFRNTSYTLLHHGIVDEANESMCVHDIIGFKAAVERLVN